MTAELSTLKLELAHALQRAETAERREEQFRTWWTGVSKQLRDLQHQYQQEDWARAESCESHGQKVKSLDAEASQLRTRVRELESGRLVLVVGLQALQDLVVAHEERLTRADLTVDAAIGAVGRIVRRTLDGKRPEQGALW